MVNSNEKEKISEAQKQIYESVVGFTNSALDFAEKMAGLQLTFARESGEAGAEHGKQLLNAKDVQELIQTHTSAFQPQFERLVNYSKDLMELSSEAQEELSQTIEGKMADINSSVLEVLENAAKNGPAGSDAAVAATKSILAASTAAYNSMNNAAKKVADVAASNIQSATEAGVKATASSAKKRKS